MVDPTAVIARAFPDWKVAILKDIGGGNSGARVAVTDFVHVGPPAADRPALQPGQYILKIQNAPTWPGEAPEDQRHAAATTLSGAFSADHIPSLRYSADFDGTSVLLYEIAGQSLASFVGADTVGVGSLKHYCGILSRDLLREWNANYTVDNQASQQSTLSSWLGYRLNASEAPQLHQFINAITNRTPLFAMAGRVLVDPLWLATNDALGTTASTVSFLGHIHGDLHPGNVLVDRTTPRSERYWLIDFALSKPAPLGFDHAYLEMALLLRHLEAAEPQRLLTIVEALDAPAESADAQSVLVQDAGIVECIQSLRAAVTTWQETVEPKRSDSVAAQFRLAQVAAGINWANKPLSETQRRLAIAYAGHAGLVYLRTFAPDTHQSLISDDSQHIEPPLPVAPDWSDIWEQLNRFDATRARYVLVTGHLESCPENSSLAMVPWSAIIDFDPQSSETGLHAAIAPTLARLRSLQQYGIDPIPVDLDRGTAWLMTNGWPSRSEPVPPNFRRWRQEYGRRIRELFSDIRRAAAPLPVKVVVLAGATFPDDYLRAVVDMIDESLGDSSDVTLIGRTLDPVDPAISVAYHTAPATFAKALFQIYGGGTHPDEPAVPGAAGAVAIPVDQLRSLEEDIEILHSRIIEDSIAAVGPHDAFWKGNPPTWAELHANEDVNREIAPILYSKLRELLDKRGNYTLELRHAPGSGGTTVSLRSGWNIRLDFPVAILRRYSVTTGDRIDQLFRLSQKPVLLIAEAALLPPAQREELYREISRRNARCVMLYVVRGLSDAATSPTEHLWLTDPISDTETALFLSAFSARTANPRRRRALKELSTAPALRRYRNPFLYGLTTFEEEFESVDRYVANHLQGASPQLERVARFLAILTRYTQTGISVALLNRLLNLHADSQNDMADIFGAPLSRLIVRREQSIRLLHPVIAEELLKQTLGGTEEWRFGLKDVALDFIGDVVGHLGSDAEEALHLLTELFIKRDFWTPGMKRRRNFSELILAMPSSAAQHEVLTKLTELCPTEAHFWNHLGRHHIYEMKQDFQAAEQYLVKAVELDPIDRVHHHSLGMVRRFWVRSIIADLLLSGTSPGADVTFKAVETLLNGAADEFNITRNLAPEDDHGYITHIQLIIEVLESLLRVEPSASLATIAQRRDAVGTWVRQSQVIAEDLLERVQHFRQQQPPSKYELRCVSGLATLYGHFDGLINALEQLEQTLGDADVRRALAGAYYSKSGRHWSRMTDAELRRTRDLMEGNLRHDPTNEHDIRTWFQASRRLPDFSYIAAIDRLEGWAAASANALDAYYYLYILHFLRWRAGAERNQDAMQAALQQCRPRAVGRRGLSYEWLAHTPSWCPLAHSSDLGEWKNEREFFENIGPLAWATGSIATIKPQAGTIRIGPQAVAYFVPGTKFVESRHLNALVQFYLGFAYDGLRAWSVDFTTLSVPMDQTTVRSDFAAARAVGLLEPSRAIATSVGETSMLRRKVHDIVADQLAIAENRGQNVLLSSLGNRLAHEFGARIYEHLGFATLAELLASYDDIVVSKAGTVATVIRAAPRTSPF